MTKTGDAREGLPSVSLRPGQVFPDWAAVASETARQTLRRFYHVVRMERWADFSEDEDSLRREILLAYARSGRAPSATELSAVTGLAPGEIEEPLRRLEARDMILRDAETGAVVGAYPLRDRATGHVVRLDGQELNAICAIDALGVGAMYGRDVEIESSCRACGVPVEVATGERGTAIARAAPPDTEVWMDLRAGAQGASTRCPCMVFFCSGAHLDDWLAGGESETGARLTLEEAFQVGKAIFGPTLAPTP